MEDPYLQRVDYLRICASHTLGVASPLSSLIAVERDMYGITGLTAKRIQPVITLPVSSRTLPVTRFTEIGKSLHYAVVDGAAILMNTKSSIVCNNS